MSLLITETRVVDPEVHNCICGGETEHSARLSAGYSGFAYVKCKDCDLEMTEHSYDVGFNGTTLEGLYGMVVSKWNNVMDKQTKN